MSGRPPARGAALVTGAARRIGRAIALELAHGGWDVAIHHLRATAAAREAVAEIERLGRRSVALAADLADEAASAGLVARAAEALGPVSLLVNSAAVFDFDRPLSADAASWQRHMAINARAPLVLTQALVRQLPEGAQANVVNLIDARAWRPTPNYTSYTASKVALWGLTRHLAVALAPQVRVNAIGPGPSLAPAGADAARFARLQAAMPLGRGGSPAEIARAVRFILDQPTLTGQMIALDGGQHLGWLLPGQLPPAG
jgi:NAD(P)-dependent dehydrogenase (short-subunit alcohol dehydrogenase family)